MSAKIPTIFVTIVMILGLGIYFKGACPVCNGAGYITTNTLGMQSLRILNATSEIRAIRAAECGALIDHEIKVNITLANEGSEFLRGAIIVVIKDLATKTVSEKAIYLEIPPNTSKNVYAREYFTWKEYVEHIFDISVELPKASGIACPICGGNGNLSFIELFVVSVAGH